MSTSFRPSRVVRGVAVALLLVPALAVAEESASPALEFRRVHVPRGRLQDVPLGDGRYVPMSAAEFEQAVARLGPAAASVTPPRGLADRSRYVLAVDDAGRLSGTVSFDVVADEGRLENDLDLGAVVPGRCSQQTAAGTGDAVVFGRPDGTVAVKTPEAGTYVCEVSVGPTRPHAAAFRLPLVPALTTSIRLQTPAGLRPVVAGEPAGRAITSIAGEGEWLIEFGPAAAVDLALVANEPAPPLVATWIDATVQAGQVEVAAALAPRSAWRAGDLRLEKPRGLRPIAVQVAAGRPIEWVETDEGARMVVRLPREAVGELRPLIMRAVMPLAVPHRWEVPFVRPVAETWAGGGTRIEVDPAFGVTETWAERCLAVTPEVAARWPLPSRAERPGEEAVAVAVDPLRPAVLHFEHQAADASLAVALRPRQPQLDVARVTTVELLPGRVLGRAACDVRVVAGEAFSLTARIAPEWIIDSVSLVEPFDLDSGTVVPPRGDAAEVDWRIGRGPDGGPELRVGLAVAATPRRSVGLRVAGHRSGVPLGSGFRTGEMDMIRFAGEAADMAVIDFDVGPEAIVEVEGAPLGIFAVPPRLARLVEPGTLRGRLTGGERAADRAARLVQRRPPLDARVDVRLAARDERLVESFTLTCRPEAAAVDSVVVHFTEPMGDGLEWSLLEPAGGTLVARRLDAADTARGDGLRMPASAESWLVEVTPAFLGPATIRAARDVSFREPRAVPLAWVDGASHSRGTVLVRDTGPARPTIRNHRLRELPPVAAAEGQPPAQAEFAFSVPQVGEAADPVAELVPAVGAEARAWAWRETVSCRCHDSGRTECEAAYDLENQGRDHVLLTVLPGRRIDGVLLDGIAVPTESLEGGGTARIPLPANSRRMRLVVRTLVGGNPRAGLWQVDPVGSTIDVPVLDHRLHLLLPPDLDVAAVPSGYRPADPAAAGLAARLFGARPARQGDPSAQSQPAAATDAEPGGFRSLPFVPVPGRDAAAGIVVIRRGLVASAGIVCAFLAFLGMLAALARRPGAAAVLAAACAAAALWLEPPWAGVARAAWWGALAGCWWWALVSRGRAGRAAVAVAVLLVCLASPDASGAEPDAADRAAEVFLTPGDDGDMALVPERLFRDLLREARPATASVRIVRCRVLVEDAAAAWRLLLDVDADAGGTLLLDQGPGDARWEPLPGGGQLEQDGRLLRLAAPAAGSQRLEARVAPAVERRGRLELASIRLPPAALARLEIVDAGGATLPAAASALQCDRAGADGPFLRVPAAADGEPGFDVSGAARVRLVRPIDPRDSLADGGLSATSDNELEWTLDACHLRARYDVSGTGIIRAVVVATDPEFAPVEDAAAEEQTVQPLGGGLYLVERTAPEPGPARIRVALRMPLVDPVGTFHAPGAWLEDVETDSRTVRLVASSDLVTAFDTPPGQTAAPRDEPASDAGGPWRYEAGRSLPAGGPLRLAVSRRRQELRGSQALAVRLEPDGIGLKLQARIDATSTPLMQIPVTVPPGCEIERVTVRDDDLAALDAGVRAPLDLQWSPTAANRLSIVVQQPRAGRYRLEVEGRLAVRPAARGRLPLMRAELAGNSPLVVSWSQDDRGPVAKVEVPAGADGPPYELADRPAPGPVASEGERPVPVAAARREDRVERAVVTLAVDDRGRMHGLARFDVVAARPVIRLRLPAQTRLFDVLVDGHVAAAHPVAADAWDVELHDAAWPRSLMLLFAGECDPLPGSGQPIRLQPPSLEGISGGDVLWSIEPPAGRFVRVAEPARLLTAADWQAADGAGRERVAAAFGRALAADETDADRLRAFAAARVAGPFAALERSWEQAIEPAASHPPVRVAAGGDGSLTVRFVRREPGVASPRAWATAALAALAAWGWVAFRRGDVNEQRLRTRLARAVPWLLVGGGLAWVAMLAPSLPGWLLLATGAASVASRRSPRPEAVAAVPPAAGSVSTWSLPRG